ncbi:MAG: hypothetical protein PVI92_02590 [Chromatiales bacterium]
MVSNEEFREIETYLKSHSADKRRFILSDLCNEPCGDPRVLPLLKSALKDRAVVELSIPIYYGELRILAAQALAAECATQGIDEPVRLIGVPTPLSIDELLQLVDKYQIDTTPDYEKGNVECYSILRDRGLVPKMNWEK